MVIPMTVDRQHLIGIGGPMEVHDVTDSDGNPAGGGATGIGFTITWQPGVVRRDLGDVPVGACIEDVLIAAVHRLEYYQAGPYACDENAATIRALQEALGIQASRRADRAIRGVLGRYAQ